MGPPRLQILLKSVIRTMRLFVLSIILLTITACQQTTAQRDELPTRFILPSSTPTSTQTTTATVTPIPPSPLPTVTLTPSLTITDTPRPVTPTGTPAPTLTGTATLTPIPTREIRPDTQPARPAATLPEQFVFGASATGQGLLARRIGQGEIVLMLVGGIHGGAEANTIVLVEELTNHFLTTPGAVLPGITLVLVPSLNPDGAAYGAVNRGRFNGNGVDLNRNWGCDWQPTAYFRTETVYPGQQPFSEPETIALATLINDLRPAAVLFYHSAADGIFAGACNGTSVSGPMVAVLGEATGYSYGQPFSEYPVHGTAASWVDSLGIPAADVELASDQFSEFQRNLRGVMALQCWLIGPEAAAVFTACNN